MGEKRHIILEDLTRIAYVDDPQFSPDGQWVAYVQQLPSAKENTYYNTIWLVNVQNPKPTQLTYSNRDTQPRWSPDGQWLVFTSARSGIAQLYLLPMFSTGGEARQITTHINGANTPTWSRDSQSIAYLGRVNAQERADEDNNTAKSATADEKKVYFDPLLINRMPYRDGTVYHDDRFAQIYVYQMDSATSKRITHQDAHYTQAEWSADSKKLYSTRIMQVGGDEYWRRANIFEIDAITGAESAILEGNHTLFDLSVSPNGKHLAFNRRNSNDTISQFDFTVLDLATRKSTVLNAKLDRPVAPYRWLNSDEMVAVVQNWGNYELHNFKLDGTTQAIVTESQQITGIDIAKDGAFALSICTMMNPSEIFYVKNAYKTQLTQANTALCAELKLENTQEVIFKSPYGDIQGWYMLPPHFEEGKQYPLAIKIHGGPQYMWGRNDRFMWHEWQYIAAQGYVVFYCNPRGSDGYGNAFCHALDYNWGELAMQDMMAAVDAMTAKPFVDKDNVVVSGGSFGGFLTTWLVAHTNRFKAGVTQRGVYNLVSFHGTTDIPTFAQSQFDTFPWENQAYLWEKSPLAHAKNINTPLLIIHSENDFRAPIEQAEQLFMWLHRMGKTVNFIRFPREGHELTRSGEPTHRMRHTQETLQWWNKHLS
jgi:dipeptidyl aminopeptidase/acylaminoacyl peptidase